MNHLQAWAKRVAPEWSSDEWAALQVMVDRSGWSKREADVLRKLYTFDPPEVATPVGPLPSQGIDLVRALIARRDGTVAEFRELPAAPTPSGAWQRTGCTGVTNDTGPTCGWPQRQWSAARQRWCDWGKDSGATGEPTRTWVWGLLPTMECSADEVAT